MATFDISNTTSWINACSYWNTSGLSTDTYRLTDDTVLDFSTLNAETNDASQCFIEFDASFNGQHKYLTLDGAGTTDISNSLFMDLSGGTIKNVIIDLSGVTTTDAIKSFLVGKNTDVFPDYGTFENITINNNTATIVSECSYFLPHLFGNYTTNKVISITNCEYKGYLTTIDKISGLFGNNFCRATTNNTINIIDCTCTMFGNMTSTYTGGLFGRYAFQSAKDSTITITNCTFKGDYINAVQCGGIFANQAFINLRDGNNIIIQDCTITKLTSSCNLSSQNTGGMFGPQFLFNTSDSTNTFDICNNTINIKLRNNQTGGMFGYNPFDKCSNKIINIKHNKINIIDSNPITNYNRAGICCFEGAYENNDNTINVIDNIITSDEDMSNTYFAGLFNVNALTLTNSSGAGEINITGNDLTGITLIPTPVVEVKNFEHVSDLPQKYKFLFNTDGIPYFDDSTNDKIFSIIDINSNTYGLIIYNPIPKNFSTYNYLLQWIYKNSLTALDEQKWFESYSLYLTRYKALH